MQIYPANGKISVTPLGERRFDESYDDCADRWKPATQPIGTFMRRLLSQTSALALASALMLGAQAAPALAQTAPAAVQFDPAQVPAPAQVQAVLERLAAAEIAALTEGDAAAPLPAGGRPVRGWRRSNSNWVSSAFYTGAARLARISDNPATYAYLQRVGERYQYSLRGAGTPTALINADDQAIGDLFAELYARRRLPGILMPLKQRLDFTVPYLTKTPQPKLVWWWSDSLFMAPPVLARMTALTGDPEYLRAMDVQWWRTYELLWDKDEHLYFRDERFITRRSDSGKKIFWGRGNGWVMAGLVRVLESMPADYPTRPRYEQLLREMSAKIITLQGPDGLWRTSLLDSKAFPEPETSGSAFFTYALAFGINHGILDRATYQPAVLKGWAGLNRHVLPNGILGQVQRAGDQPVAIQPTDTAPYGSGGFLLAGLEVMNLGKPVTALPLAEPKRDAVVVIASDMAPNRPATTPAEERENARRDAERQAMEDLTYHPEKHDPAYRDPVLARVVGNSQSTVKIVPATPAQQVPRATVRFAPDRFDDILWENDRTAHRIYGPTLEAREPPSGSGVDAWVKRVRWPFMDRQLKTVTYHNDQGEGMDFYNVKSTRGVGGLGVWADNKLWTSRNFKTYKILKDGPDAASFTVDYAPWPVGVDRKVWETKTFTLPMGTNFTRVVSTLHSDSTEPMIVGIGLGKNATVPGAGRLMADRATGRISYWEPADPDHGQMGTALMVDPASIVETKADADNNLILIRVTPGKPFVYYLGAGWDRGLDFQSREAWETYVKAQTPNFDPAK